LPRSRFEYAAVSRNHIHETFLVLQQTKQYTACSSTDNRPMFGLAGLHYTAHVEVVLDYDKGSAT